jgi:hypothetical protein
MAIRESLVERDILIGMGAGPLGSLVVGPVNSILSRFISEAQGRREMAVREGSSHDVAASKVAKKFGGEEPSERAKHLSRVAFATGYGIGWGVIYAIAWRAAPPASRFAACRLEPPSSFFAMVLWLRCFACHRLCGEFLGSLCKGNAQSRRLDCRCGANASRR